MDIRANVILAHAMLRAVLPKIHACPPNDDLRRYNAQHSGTGFASCRETCGREVACQCFMFEEVCYSGSRHENVLANT